MGLGRNLLADYGVNEGGEKVGDYPPFHHTYLFNYLRKAVILAFEVIYFGLSVLKILP